ncbi:amino acid adenylation domain-containing protein, partial [Gordonia rubripertincta]
GNSLSAMRLVARVSDALGVQVGIRDVFDAPSVRELVAAVADRRPALPPVVPVESRPERIPLSFAQQRMWFINQMEPELATYNIPAVFTLSGEIDVDLLRTATADVVARHEILRTTFPAVDGLPYQQIDAPAAIAERLDWRVVASADELAADMRCGFDVAHEWPLRARVLHTGDGQATLALVAHHIAFDGQSFEPLATDLFAAYEARSRGAAPNFAPLEIQYADYALWQRDVLGAPEDSDSVLGGQLAYWRDRLAGLPDVLELPADRSRPLVASHRGDVLTFDIPADIGRRVDAIATRHGATRFMVLHAAFAVLLARLTGTHDIAVGTPIGGRGQSELDAMVGMFVNTLVLRTEIDSASGFDAVLDRVRADDLDAFAHADVPFESVVDAVNPVRSEAFSPLVQVILSVDPIGADITGTATVDGLTVTPMAITEAPAQVDLNLTVSTGSADEDWSGILTYATDLFDQGTVEEMSRWFLRLLDGMLASEQAAVGDIRLLAAEQDQALLAGSVGPTASDAEETIADLVGARVADSAQSIALVTGERTLTYRDFGLRIAAVARTLIAEGVGPNTAVGVIMRRSAGTVIAVHAIMAAGGQYVPIDPDTPADRARYMVETAGIGPVLVEKAHRPVEVLDVLDGRSPIIELDADAPLPADATPLSTSERLATLRPDDAAYTLFTSGSTGRPKGVTISHRAVANFVAWFDSLIPAGPQRLLFKTPHTFDASVLELFWPLTAGQTMVIADAEGHRDPDYLADVMAETGVTIAQFVPSLLSVFLDVVDRPDLLTGLQVLFSGGEALPPAVLRRFAERVPHARVVNLFGPTEAAVYTMSSALDEPVDVVPIGRPMPNTAAYVLDDRLHPVPDGVAGELYLGGVQSARGYAARPDLTAERFVADPFGAPGARLYRTGDLVRRRRTGELDYLGRTDFQVKLRGQRLELGEVESAIADAPGVVHAAARVVAGPAGDQLVGYVAPATVDLDAVRASLADALAEYMRPTAWVLLDEMPLNSAGKVDRRSLPEPELGDAEYVAPASEAEEVIAGVFAGLLGVEQVSVTQSFFDLGGNSLSAMRLTSRVSDALGVQVGIRDVFDAPSVRELAAAVAHRAAALPPVVRVEPRPVRVPLSFAQQRMWFINQLDSSSGMYNVPLVLRVSGALDVVALRAAVVDVVARHETLRTTFPSADGEPFQFVHDVEEIAGRLDWRQVESVAEVESAVAGGFSLDRDWPVRVRLWAAAPGEHVVAVVMHHIASDGESLSPLVSDLVSAYLARSSSGSPTFAPLDVQYADFALWQREVLGSPDDPSSVVGRQLGFWTEQLAGLPDVLELPTDRPRPQVASGRGVRTAFEVPGAVTERVRRVADAHGVTPFMVLHAALAVTLSRLSGTDDIAIGTPIAGRGQQGLDPLVGMFVNTLVLRTDVGAGRSFVELLDHVHTVDVDAFANADVPFEAVVDAVDPVRSGAFAPLAQVMLVATPVDADVSRPVQFGDLEFAPVVTDEVPAQRDLTVYVEFGANGGWSASVVAATDLFDVSSVRRMADRFVRVLDVLSADPSMAVGDVDLLSVDERAALAQLPVPVTQTANSGRTLVELFADSVAAHRDLVAVSASGRSLSYAELDARSDAVAAGLIVRGVSAGDLVGIATARSVDLMASILGVLKAGAGYLPLDLGNPVERLSFIVADAEVSVVIGDASSADHALWAGLPGSAQVVDIEDLVADQVSDGWVPVRVPADARAYVIYTSGSTGRPKGVEITHRDVVTLMDTAAADFEFSASDVWTMFHSYAFDFSVWEMWGPLLTGARLLIVDRELARDPRAFLDVLATERVTVLSQTPSAFYQLIDARRDDDRDLALRYVVFGGEALSFDQVRRWFDENPSDSAQLVNMYGITETTVHVSFRALDRDLVSGTDASLIGRPLASLGIHILDDRLYPVPDGVPGEMYVTGGQLAAGYLKRPGLSATRFVANPFAAGGSRMYRTGDRARRVGADIEYLGRGDAQVQLRGFRIEFGEIEAALLAAMPTASAAAARVITDAVRGDQLVGYLVLGADADVDAAQVRSAMAEHVPGYMVPDAVVAVERLPLNHNGKLDRNALQAPEFAETEYVAPASPAEESVAAVYAELLGLEQVSVTESFFDLGGNSLLAARLAARVSAALGAEVSVRDVFDASSVRSLVMATSDAAPALPPIVRVAPRPGRVPLSFAQQRMWFINQLEPSSGMYNIPALLRVSGALDVDALHAALGDVLARHEVLRTTFPSADGEPYQLVHAVDEIAERLDWRQVGSISDIEAAVSGGFALERGWPLRARVWECEPGEHVVAVVMHHIASDGESLTPLVTDLVTAYVARSSGEPPAFAPLDVQYADFALWQRDVLGSPDDAESVVGRQLAYWSEKLAGLPDVLELPADRPRPAVASGRGVRTAFDIPSTVTERVQQVADAHGVTPFMVLHAALAVTLSRLSGTNDIAIGTPIAGRGREALDPLIGMFVNTLVLRTDVDTASSFTQLLDRVHTVDVDAFANADVPFEAVVDAVNPVRSEAFAPLAQVMLVAAPRTAGVPRAIELGDLEFAPVVTDEVPAQRDLTVNIEIGGTGAWTGSIVAAADLFDVETVDVFASRLVSVLDGLTAAPGSVVGDVALLSAAEDESVRALESGSSVVDSAAFAGVGSLADGLSRAVAADPGRDALVFGDRTVSFGEFGARVWGLARELISVGVGPDVAVAVVIPRSVEL